MSHEPKLPSFGNRIPELLVPSRVLQLLYSFSYFVRFVEFKLESTERVALYGLRGKCYLSQLNSSVSIIYSWRKTSNEFDKPLRNFNFRYMIFTAY